MQTASEEGSRIADPQLDQTIEQLVNETIPDEQTGRRGELRIPFCRPLSILLDGGATIVSAFSRDISPKGIGLMHSFPLEPGEIVVQIPSRSGDPVRIRTEILWTEFLATQWYMSGGRFIEQVTCE